MTLIIARTNLADIDEICVADLKRLRLVSDDDDLLRNRFAFPSSGIRSLRHRPSAVHRLREKRIEGLFDYLLARVFGATTYRGKLRRRESVEANAPSTFTQGHRPTSTGLRTLTGTSYIFE